MYHRLNTGSQRLGRGNRSALLRAIESDPEVLRRVSGEAGLPAARVAAVLEHGEGTAEVRRLETKAHRLGVRGVPLLRIGSTFISGARTSSVLVAALRAAAEAEPLVAE